MAEQVSLAAGSLAISNGGTISTAAFGGGNAGKISLDVAGPVSIDGAQSSVASQATPQSTGTAGSVAINAGSLTVSNGAQITTATHGPGAGGDIALAVGGDILLSGSGPIVTALPRATAGGIAGSITLTAANLSLQDGAAISTQAITANGGNITLSVADFLCLVSSKINTFRFMAPMATGAISRSDLAASRAQCTSSSIVAQAVAGHGGNITIVAGDFIASNDSLVSASSQLGISGSIELIGPRVDLNGSLVVLSSELRSAAAVLRTSCDARGRTQSSLVDARARQAAAARYRDDDSGALHRQSGCRARAGQGQPRRRSIASHAGDCPPDDGLRMSRRCQP